MGCGSGCTGRIEYRSAGSNSTPGHWPSRELRRRAIHPEDRQHRLDVSRPLFPVACAALTPVWRATYDVAAVGRPLVAMADDQHHRTARFVGHGGWVLPSPESVTAQWVRASARALIAGYVDSYALLKFGVYVSFMTGNTTSAGLFSGQHDFREAAHSLLPIPCFLVGILLGTLLARSGGHRDHGLARVSALVAAMLSVATAAAYLAWPEWSGVVILSIAMGLMNTSIVRVGAQAVSLGFMTGDLNSMAQHLARGIQRAPVEEAQGSWDTHWWRAALLAGLWTTFFCGAVLGAVLALRIGFWTLLLGAGMLLILSWAERASAMPSAP